MVLIDNREYVWAFWDKTLYGLKSWQILIASSLPGKDNLSVPFTGQGIESKER